MNSAANPISPLPSSLPTTCCAPPPPRKKRTVGSALTRNRRAAASFSSTSTLAKVATAPKRIPSCRYTGDTCPHAPHQSALNLATKIWSPSAHASATRSNASMSSTSMGGHPPSVAPLPLKFPSKLKRTVAQSEATDAADTAPTASSERDVSDSTAREPPPSSFGVSHSVGSAGISGKGGFGGKRRAPRCLLRRCSAGTSLEKRSAMGDLGSASSHHPLNTGLCRDLRVSLSFGMRTHTCRLRARTLATDPRSDRLPRSLNSWVRRIANRWASFLP
mmetsp:Transcript_16868/g.28824  ORF Transcript_16868/g.28824 Transcript_16868/m.28824 type:complete len:276 (-) Transcript_16868:1887-2714(-)